MAALLALTAVLGYQARGLEGRVLEAVQPHLLTDVQVGAVALTVWDSWPNVEVVLSDVRIEDAVQEDAPFVELKALGVVFAWKPLLFGQLEVAEVVAQGGQINVHRYRDGRENWQFWQRQRQRHRDRDTATFSTASGGSEPLWTEGTPFTTTR